jgi:hypothetical protein
MIPDDSEDDAPIEEEGETVAVMPGFDLAASSLRNCPECATPTYVRHVAGGEYRCGAGHRLEWHDGELRYVPPPKLGGFSL